jgi:hypothetical protein
LIYNHHHIHRSPQTALILRTLTSSTSSANPSPAPPDAPPIRSFRLLHRTRAVAKFTGYFILSAAFGVLAIGAGIFIHDALTYTDKHIDRVPVSPLALKPECSGPKKLPVVTSQIDDDQDEASRNLSNKPHIVIIGSGWGVRVHDHFIYASR